MADKIDYGTLKKGGFMRQKQKGYFSLRLGIVGGQVTAEQLAAVTDVANTFGHGYIHLTARQGIEIPFINIKDIDAVKAALAADGITGTEAASELNMPLSTYCYKIKKLKNRQEKLAG